MQAIQQFKQIELIDPLGQLPSLTIIPAAPDGYSRAPVARRKSTGRITVGQTKFGGPIHAPYYNWVISADLVREEQVMLFEAIAARQNDRYGVPQAQSGHLVLVDKFRKVPPVADNRYTLVPDTQETTPYGLTTGFAAFKVILNLDTEYLKEQTSCRYRLNFSAEEVS